VVGDTPGGHDQSRVEEYVKEIDLKAVDRKRGATAAVTVFIASLVILGM